MTLFCLFGFFFFKKKKERKTVSRCLGCLVVLHFTDVRMYLHVYLICTQGPKMIFENAARLVPRPPCWASRGAGQPSFTRVHRRTFQRSACDCSASFVCTLTAEDWSSQCLKHTLLLASMTNLSTTVVMLCVFMSTSIVLIFFFCNLLLAV